MKKLITLCFFVFAMFLGNQSVVAQNTKLTDKIEINTRASEQTEALRKYIKFDDNQRDEVYEALREYHQVTFSVNKQTTIEEGVVEKIETQLESKMKSILTEEQFLRYKNFPQG
jgi:hypothetical protein